jgi:hypothetical protein
MISNPVIRMHIENGSLVIEYADGRKDRKTSTSEEAWMCQRIASMEGEITYLKERMNSLIAIRSVQNVARRGIGDA